MSKSSLIRLSAVILVMLMLVLVLQNKDEMISNGNLFVPEVDSRLDDIHKLELHNGTDQLLIERNASGDWVLAQAQNYLVDTAQLAVFLRTIASATTIEEKTSKPEYYKRLGVEGVSPEGNTVELTLDWDTGKAAILFGDTLGSYRYARQVDQSTAWLVDADVNISFDATAWLNTELTNIDASDVLEVSIVHNNGESVNIILGDDVSYLLSELPEGRSLKYASILDSIGAALFGLNFDRVRAQSESVQTVKPADTTTTFRLSDETQIVSSRYIGEADEEISWFRLEVTPSDQQSTVLSNAELEGFRRAVDGWEFQFTSFKADQFTQTMENLLAPQE
jgi:hypothetical protein